MAVSIAQFVEEGPGDEIHKLASLFHSMRSLHPRSE
jgi:hypothetical protein